MYKFSDVGVVLLMVNKYDAIMKNNNQKITAVVQKQPNTLGRRKDKNMHKNECKNI